MYFLKLYPYHGHVRIDIHLQLAGNFAKNSRIGAFYIETRDLKVSINADKVGIVTIGIITIPMYIYGN